MTETPRELPEFFISVDVETAGPNPGEYSMLSIGACPVDDPDNGFYIELKPTLDAALEESLEISKLSMEELAEHGVAPEDAMRRFEQWIEDSTPAGHKAVFTAFNAPFDWMFVDDYFRRFLGRNPFGYSALDMKAYYMGKAGVSWARTSMRYLSPLYLEGHHLTHNALGDARDQAELFRAILADPLRSAPAVD